MRLTIGETSRLMGISVRTLHYYDQIGLFTPSETSEAGYRYYDDENLEHLQQILFFRELELPLAEISHILSQPDFDRMQALRDHRELLRIKQQHISDLLRLVDDTLEGRDPMNKEDYMFTDYEKAKAQYAQETKERWGHTDAYKESSEKEKSRTIEETDAMMKKAEGIFMAFAEARSQSPDASEVRALVTQWQNHISEYHYNCTDEILQGLGAMYTEDERFKKNIDKYGAGTAQFISDAILAFFAS